jgi:hypothetical protein
MREERDSRRGPDPPVNNPKYPPQSLMRREVRRFAVMSYLGPVVVLFVVIGIALIYWGNRTPVPSHETPQLDATGTTGFQPQGGGGARPKSDSTADELKFKGSSLATGAAQPERGAALTEIDRVASAKTAGLPVSLPLVEVSAVEGGSFWIHDGNNRVVVIPPDRVQVKNGQHVSVDGITEIDPSGSVRVRASRVDVH